MGLFGKKTTAGDDEIAKLKSALFSADQTMREQSDRIYGLAAENESLKSDLGVYRGKDGDISLALQAAVQRAREIEESAKLKYKFEMERLKNFHVKWITQYEAVKSKVPLTPGMLSAESFLYGMDKILGFKNIEKSKTRDGDAMEQFMDESQRLNLTKSPESDKLAAAADTEFDMDDILSPKNLPDLADLIKDIIGDKT